ncbi:MAG: alpha/beta hydrolase [Polyangiaceae bacterium]|nr:alpha/beta hydrolase [Polyangiaceae bacterium]
MRYSTKSAWGMLAVGACLAGCHAEEPEAPATSVQAVTLSKQTISLSTGIDLAYIEMGNPAGKPVIFLHGYTDTSRSFYPTATALAQKNPNLHIFALDQRGHGASSMPPAASCAHAPENCFRPIDLANDVIAFMDQKCIDSAAIVGHSMGSFVAQELGLTYPERVDRMVLIGTSGKIQGNFVLQEFIINEPVEGSWKAGFEAQGYTFPDDVYNLTPLDANADALSWVTYGWVVDPAADQDFLAEIVPETASTKMGTWIGAARALSQVDNTERLKSLTVPTFIIWATQDAFFYDTDQAALRESLDVPASACDMSYYFKQYGKRPLSELGIQIDDLGHNTQWATPEETATDIASYLKHKKPTKDWYYSANGDPQTIVTKKGKAPMSHAPGNKNCGF